MRGTWAVIVIAIALATACSGDRDPRASALCTRISTVCSEHGVTATCSEDVAAVRDLVSAEDYARFLRCGIEAASCEEIAGCIVGTMELDADDTAERFERGLDKMRDRLGPKGDPRERRDRAPTSDAADAALPPECAPLVKVCASDDDLVRMRCRDMIGKLTTDTANRGKLGTCVAGAANCYAVENCITDLWFELRR